MATRAAHYAAAERILTLASEDLREPSSTPLERIALRIAAAQVHANLAAVDTDAPYFYTNDPTEGA